ncbi:MAG TPA: Uma2 family endonuclease [Chloroflexota bacterium]|nr:Uma2 family endonuclease [Chloroflexota bacterium]
MVQATTWATPYRVPDTLRSDTEESVVGTQWHQNAISALSDMLEDVARRRGATWGVCNQIALLGLQHEDGTPYNPRPDVMVLAQPLPSGHMSSISLGEAGVPLFIAEIASDSTVGNDVGDKRLAYAAIGVPEYIVFDPDGDLFSPPLRAWRLQAGGYVPWKPEADGSWRSAALDVAFEPTQPYLGMRDRDGRPIELPRTVRERAEHLEQQLSEVEQRRAELEEQLRRLRAERGEEG